jgi:hypothetical protein
MQFLVEWKLFVNLKNFINSFKSKMLQVICSSILSWSGSRKSSFRPVTTKHDFHRHWDWAYPVNCWPEYFRNRTTNQLQIAFGVERGLRWRTRPKTTGSFIYVIDVRFVVRVLNLTVYVITCHERKLQGPFLEQRGNSVSTKIVGSTSLL